MCSETSNWAWKTLIISRSGCSRCDQAFVTQILSLSGRADPAIQLRVRHWLGTRDPFFTQRASFVWVIIRGRTDYFCKMKARKGEN